MKKTKQNTFLSALAQSMSVWLGGGWYWCQSVRVNGEPSDHSTVGDDPCFQRPIQTSLLSPESAHSIQFTKSVYGKTGTLNNKEIFPHNMLTISQKVEEHFHFRERADAGEVSPSRVTCLRRLLPSSFCFRQQPVAEPLMWPPTATAFCMDILPVLCKRKN